MRDLRQVLLAGRGQRCLTGLEFQGIQLHPGGGFAHILGCGYQRTKGLQGMLEVTQRSSLDGCRQNLVDGIAGIKLRIIHISLDGNSQLDGIVLVTQGIQRSIDRYQNIALQSGLAVDLAQLELAQYKVYLTVQDFVFTDKFQVGVQRATVQLQTQAFPGIGGECGQIEGLYLSDQVHVHWLEERFHVAAERKPGVLADRALESQRAFLLGLAGIELRKRNFLEYHSRSKGRFYLLVDEGDATPLRSLDATNHQVDGFRLLSLALFFQRRLIAWFGGCCRCVEILDHIDKAQHIQIAILVSYDTIVETLIGYAVDGDQAPGTGQSRNLQFVTAHKRLRFCGILVRHFSDLDLLEANHLDRELVNSLEQELLDPQCLGADQADFALACLNIEVSQGNVRGQLNFGAGRGVGVLETRRQIQLAVLNI